MSQDHYRRALEAAVREYEQALADQAVLDTRIAHLRNTIGTLNKLCGYEPTVPMGLTDACRMVLRSAGRPLTAVEIRERLTAFGFDVERYANGLAAIHTVLKRLVDAGEIGEGDRDETARTAYEMLGSGVTASRTGGREPLGGRARAGVGLCPPKDRPKLARGAQLTGATKKTKRRKRTR